MSVPNNLFRPSHRLLQKFLFMQVFKRAKRVNVPGCTLLYFPNELKHSRLGIAVSKKQVAKAVQRNRIKRQIREFFRKEQEIVGPHDIVFVVYKEFAQCSKENLAEQLQQLWVKFSHKQSEGYH